MSEPTIHTSAPSAPADDMGAALDLHESLFEGVLALGKVTAQSSEALTVALDKGGTATVPASEWGDAAQATPGAPISVLLEEGGKEDGTWLASRKKAMALELWDRLAAAADERGEVEGEVVAKNKGGLTVDVGMRAFMPASQVELWPVDDLGAYVGKRLRVVVSEFGGKKGELVVTRRPVLERERTAQRAETLKTLAEGQIVSGVVRRFAPFGAFVDVGGVDGLLHVSDMSWSHVTEPRSLLREGQAVRVKVLKLERGGDKLSLGLKQTMPDPWASVAEKYPAGGRVRGLVARLTEFGAFVELEPGIDGLVHATELAWGQRPKHPSEIVKVGDELDLVVLELDTRERRIALSAKRALTNPWESFARAHAVGTKVQGTVKRLADFGAFVEVAPGVEGLLHVSDLSWTERVRHPREKLEEGQALELVVLGCDADAERVSLGLKQLSSDPWAAFAAANPAGTRTRGTVTKLADFGAFFSLAEGVEGLCHVSELAGV